METKEKMQPKVKTGRDEIWKVKPATAGGGIGDIGEAEQYVIISPCAIDSFKNEEEDECQKLWPQETSLCVDRKHVEAHKGWLRT